LTQLQQLVETVNIFKHLTIRTPECISIFAQFQTQSPKLLFHFSLIKPPTKKSHKAGTLLGHKEHTKNINPNIKQETILPATTATQIKES